MMDINPIYQYFKTLLTGSASASSINCLAADSPCFPKKGFPAQGINGCQLLHRKVRRLSLRTCPLSMPEPNYQTFNCKRREGFCQDYCNLMETQVGYCSKKKDACCI
ncbi:sperm-associated antigen 11B-like [Meriones unguiculatus]|uniref:sperm-associated antigen 11B-like n=1 Tax=Meriones unguiculatus TaxID=10047 RepID=UPI00293E74E4|nr:sperm-associated antigen 11B-like [Meriones unguiculatus]